MTKVFDAFDFTLVLQGQTAGSKISFANSQQVLPLAKFARKAHALGDLEGRDDVSLDLLASLSSPLAD
jgi:hypothetical protein